MGGGGVSGDFYLAMCSVAGGFQWAEWRLD